MKLFRENGYKRVSKPLKELPYACVNVTRQESHATGVVVLIRLGAQDNAVEACLL